MGEIFSALGAGLQGLAGGLQQRRENRVQDAQLNMDQREFDLRMKKLGLDLESAEYERDLSIARGTPQEVAQREFQANLAKFAQDAEMFKLKKQLVESQISENESTGKAALMRASGGGKAAKEPPLVDPGIDRAIKEIDSRIKQVGDYLDTRQGAGAAPEELNGIAMQLKDLQDRREMLSNSVINELGMGFPEEVAAPQAPAPEVKPPAIPLMRRLAGNSDKPYPDQVGDLLRPAAQGASKGLGAGLMGLLTGLTGSTTNPIAATMPMPQAGQNVTLDKLNPELVKRMIAAGLLKDASKPAGTFNPWLPYNAQR